MSDREVIQRAFETDLATIYAVFVSNYTTALSDSQKEADAEAAFQKAIAHARHIRDRALELLP